MDSNVKSLKERLITWIVAGIDAHNDLHTNSVTAEDAIRAFQDELKDRINHIADTSVDALRYNTEDKNTAINKALQEVTEHLRIITLDENNGSKVQLAEQCIESSEITTAFQNIAVKFEGNLDVAEYLNSLPNIGQCMIDSTVKANVLSNDVNGDADGVAANTEKKVEYYSPYDCITGCRVAGELSWNSSSLRLGTFTSISNNSYYGTLSISESVPTDKDMSPDEGPNADAKILNIPSMKPSGMAAVRYVGEFEAYKHRTPCVISDILLLADMKIVVTDHYHCSIQLFAEDFSPLDEKSCPNPINVCALTSTTVAVTLRRNRQLAIYRVHDTSLQQERVIGIKCDSYIWQATYKADRLFVVCDDNNIHVMDTNGVAIATIRSGVPTECGYLRYFDVNDSGTQIYLCEKRGLRCINSKGKLQWRFTTDDFPKKERDKHGHVIEDVCSCNGMILGVHWTLSKVFQISTDGKYMRNIIVDNLDHPRAISMAGNRLAVTQFHPQMKSIPSRTIKMFEML